ncbi:MAG TPA: branched-chain amino acid ABC transporter permease [Candidatus Methylomirabilis sp.]|nr:branched-chain amino acid ABC transporter permease [Candidatus Methylomirabilis sp.]
MRAVRFIALAVALLALPLLPGFNNDFARSMLSQMGIAAIFALSFNMLLGQTGLLSFGHAVYFGLGGYIAIHVMRLINQGLPVPMPLVPAFGALGGLAFGILFGSVTTKRAGTVFAMITLGLGELVVAASLMLTRFFGGEEGITANRTRGPHPFGLTFGSQLEVYYVIAAWVFISVASMYAFTRTPLGRMCNAVRDNSERVEFVGYNPQRVRFITFTISAMFAGIAGGLHAINYEIVSAEALGAARSGAVLLMAFIGGIGSFAGPVLGAIVITWLQVSLSDWSAAWQLYLGLFFVIMVLFAPGGLTSLIQIHAPLLRARRLHRLLPSYLITAVPALVMTAGAVFLLEINYRLATRPELGTRTTFFSIPVDMATPWPWLTGLGLVAGGFYGLRWSWSLVADAWNAVGEQGPAAERR